MSDDLARQLRGPIGSLDMTAAMLKAADALEAKEREIERLRTAEAEAMAVVLSLEGTVEHLRAEIESLKRDAERYQWLRNCSAQQRTEAMFCRAGDCKWWRTSEEMDAGVDAAMSQQERA